MIIIYIITQPGRFYLSKSSTDNKLLSPVLLNGRTFILYKFKLNAKAAQIKTLYPPENSGSNSFNL